MEKVDRLTLELIELENAFDKIRELTIEIKRCETAMNIYSKVERIAKDLVLQKIKVDMELVDDYINDVRQIERTLESTVYSLEDPFKQAIKEYEEEIFDLENGYGQ